MHACMRTSTIFWMVYAEYQYWLKSPSSPTLQQRRGEVG